MDETSNQEFPKQQKSIFDVSSVLINFIAEIIK